MKFVITEKGLIPEKHKDTFDPFWGSFVLFHDYFEHFYEGTGIFIEEFYENILGEIASVGASYYLYNRIKLFDSKVKLIEYLTKEVYAVMDNEIILKKYKNNTSFIKSCEEHAINFKINRELKTLSNIIWDKHLTYNKKNIFLFENNYNFLIYKALKIGYKLCKEKFETVATKHIYNFRESLKRLKNKDCKWFYDNFKSAEIITNKKGRIKLKFHK